MQSPVASPAIPAIPASFPPSLGGTTETVAGVDFAAMLLGQLGANGEDMASIIAAEPAAMQTTEGAVNESTDPSLLLATIGFSMEMSLPAADVRLMPAEPSSLTATAGNSRLPALVSGEAGAATALLTDDASPTAGTAAKFAGFEQVLAEATGGGPEGTTAPTSLHANAPPAARPHAEATQQMTAPLRDPAWPAEFGQKLVWMATQDKQSAQITLNPPQMGPIEISLNLKSDQATALFVSTNAEVREALEAAIPRLREMLAGVGVELGQANVSAESFAQAKDDGQGRGNGTGRFADDDAGTGAVPAATNMLAGNRSGNGLVDTFV